MRNSSLVKRTCADNVTGLSLTPKPGMKMVGERRGRDEGSAVSAVGRATSEDAGMSSDKTCENQVRRKSKGSDARSVRVG